MPAPPAAGGLVRMHGGQQWHLPCQHRQNHFRKLSVSENSFLLFCFPYHCECEQCMSSLKLSKGTMSVAVHISSLLYVSSVCCYQDEWRRAEGVKRAEEQQKEAVYTTDKKPNKVCADSINLQWYCSCCQHIWGQYRGCKEMKRSPLVILSTISLGNNWSDTLPLSLISVVTAFSVWELKTKMLQTSPLWLVQKHWWSYPIQIHSEVLEVK